MKRGIRIEKDVKKKERAEGEDDKYENSNNYGDNDGEMIMVIVM